LNITYNARHFKTETIHRLIDNWRNALRQIIVFCLNSKAKEITPSDLGYTQITIEEVENFFE